MTAIGSDQAQYIQRLDVEAFTTTTFTGYVRVIELETFVQTFFSKVQLSAVKVNQTLSINDDFDAFFFKDLITLVQLVYELQYVAMPEQPEVRTPSLRPMPLPRFARKVATRLAAASVIVMAIQQPLGINLVLRVSFCNRSLLL